MLDSLQEECGVFAVFNHADAANLTALGLHALQHRGQESAGIISSDGKKFYIHKEYGLVSDIFTSNKIISKLSQGQSSIGHVRYSTSGEKNDSNIQPVYGTLKFGDFAVAHNGNLTNSDALKQQLIKEGAIFQSTMDTETIIHLMARSSFSNMVECLVDAVGQIMGAFCLVAMSHDKIVAVRDVRGIRPLSLGKLGDSYVVSSETCGFDIIGAEFMRDIAPGEVVIIDKEGIKSLFPFESKSSKFCVFEYIYFARPDSMIEGKNVYNVRKSIGKYLAKQSNVKADLVVPVPDSGIPSALGYSEESEIPFEFGIIRNHYVGRTFIEPTDKIRHFGVKLKHNPNRELLEGKDIILIDDSIVRGTTSKKIVKMLKSAGVGKVHMRISSPPITHSCFYGIDTPEKGQLLASHMSIEEIRQFLEADSLEFISNDNLYRSIIAEDRKSENPQFCDACFTGDYFVPLIDYNNKHSEDGRGS